MDVLKELIAIVDRHKVKKIEVIGNAGAGSSKIGELYERIRTGKLSNDEDAADYFYGTENKFANYKKLKYRLKQRLINTIFFIDVNKPGFNQIQRAYYSCYKEMAAFKILLGRGARRTAIPLAEKTLTKAIKFEFTDIVLDVTRFLRNHYGLITGDRKRYNKYNALVKQYRKILEAELTAEEYHSDLAINFIRSKSSKAEIIEMAVTYSQELRTYLNEFQSYRLTLFAYLVFSLRYRIAHEYSRLIEVCEEAIQSFQRKGHMTSKVAIFNFLLRMLACHIQLKEYEKGEVVVNRCLSLVPSGNNNWFATLEYYFILSMHTGRFQKAYEIFCEASQNKRFKLLYQSPSEDWRIYEAYAYFFISIGKIRPEISNYKPKLKKFKLAKFLNEVPTFSKDKRGMNINILIIQILFLLQRKDFGAIIDRMETLETYCYRHLRKGDTFRSNCFLKMLLLLPKAGFHKGRVIHRAKKYLEKLRTEPLEVANLSSEVEIIPYGVLWKFVVASLDDKIRAF